MPSKFLDPVANQNVYDSEVPFFEKLRDVFSEASGMPLIVDKLKDIIDGDATFESNVESYISDSNKDTTDLSQQSQKLNHNLNDSESQSLSEQEIEKKRIATRLRKCLFAGLVGGPIEQTPHIGTGSTITPGSASAKKLIAKKRDPRIEKFMDICCDEIQSNDDAREIADDYSDNFLPALAIQVLETIILGSIEMLDQQRKLIQQKNGGHESNPDSEILNKRKEFLLKLINFFSAYRQDCKSLESVERLERQFSELIDSREGFNNDDKLDSTEFQSESSDPFGLGHGSYLQNLNQNLNHSTCSKVQQNSAPNSANSISRDPIKSESDTNNFASKKSNGSYASLSNIGGSGTPNDSSLSQTKKISDQQQSSQTQTTSSKVGNTNIGPGQTETAGTESHNNQSSEQKFDFYQMLHDFGFFCFDQDLGAGQKSLLDDLLKLPEGTTRQLSKKLFQNMSAESRKVIGKGPDKKSYPPMKISECISKIIKKRHLLSDRDHQQSKINSDRGSSPIDDRPQQLLSNSTTPLTGTSPIDVPGISGPPPSLPPVSFLSSTTKSNTQGDSNIIIPPGPPPPPPSLPPNQEVSQSQLSAVSAQSGAGPRNLNSSPGSQQGLQQAAQKSSNSPPNLSDVNFGPPPSIQSFGKGGNSIVLPDSGIIDKALQRLGPMPYEDGINVTKKSQYLRLKLLLRKRTEKLLVRELTEEANGYSSLSQSTVTGSLNKSDSDSNIQQLAKKVSEQARDAVVAYQVFAPLNQGFNRAMQNSAEIEASGAFASASGAPDSTNPSGVPPPIHFMSEGAGYKRWMLNQANEATKTVDPVLIHHAQTILGAANQGKGHVPGMNGTKGSNNIASDLGGAPHLNGKGTSKNGKPEQLQQTGVGLTYESIDNNDGQQQPGIPNGKDAKGSKGGSDIKGGKFDNGKGQQQYDQSNTIGNIMAKQVWAVANHPKILANARKKCEDNRKVVESEFNSTNIKRGCLADYPPGLEYDAYVACPGSDSQSNLNLNHPFNFAPSKRAPPPLPPVTSIISNDDDDDTDDDLTDQNKIHQVQDQDLSNPSDTDIDWNDWNNWEWREKENNWVKKQSIIDSLNAAAAQAGINGTGQNAQISGSLTTGPWDSGNAHIPPTPAATLWDSQKGVFRKRAPFFAVSAPTLSHDSGFEN